MNSFGKLVDRAEHDMLAGGEFLRSNAKIDTSGGAGEIWGKVVDLHQNHVELADRALKGYGEILNSSSSELIRSAQYYKDTDIDQAAAVDAVYGGSGRGAPPSASIGAATDIFGGGFNDRTDAQACLAATRTPEQIYEHAGMPSVFASQLANVASVVKPRIDGIFNNSNGALGVIGELVGDVLDLTSPSVLVNEGLKLAFGWDLFGDLANCVAGDWGTFNECAQAWAKLGSLCAAVATNVSHGNDLLSLSWQGQAANVAWDYFHAVAEKLLKAQETFNKIDECYQKIGGEIASFVNMLKAAISTIADLALMAALEAAAGAASGFTGVGLVVTAAAAADIALRVARMIQLSTEIGTALTGLYLAIQGAQTAGQAEVIATLSEIKSFPVPKAGYDNQVV
ncbi:hypothetical protein [Streptomyces natalensis]|uniref:Uncharacterized protein n=1 Tax=Streptomyces natalensis ATCC 27448 TaxID=1240678 RepID=A0A0D7CK67_9ACTN|nr:hypothetical protein [Streptomyces natalensis]KIZ16598.1 hypothetical protein SNA_20115 [Streptomyces natalensis ATCC 27448]